MRSFRHTSAVGTLALSCTLAASTTSAQHASEAPASCTLQVAPQNLDAGLGAVQVNARLSEDIGAVTGLRATAGSGIRLTSPEKVRRLFATADEEGGTSPGSIEMAPDANEATLWLNLVRAQPGTYIVTVHGESDSCTGTVTVRGYR